MRLDRITIFYCDIFQQNRDAISNGIIFCNILIRYFRICFKIKINFHLKAFLMLWRQDVIQLQIFTFKKHFFTAARDATGKFNVFIDVEPEYQYSRLLFAPLHLETFCSYFTVEKNYKNNIKALLVSTSCSWNYYVAFFFQK